MSLPPIASCAELNTALSAISHRISSEPQQREAISKDLEFLSKCFNFLLYNGTEIQITHLAACRIKFDQVWSAFKRGTQPAPASSTALNPLQPDSSIFILPAECMRLIFCKAMGNQSEPIILGTLSLVCKGWQTLALNDPLWESIFKRCLQNLTYDINHSSATSFREKIRLLNETKLADFKKTILECIKAEEESNSTELTQTSFNNNECEFECEPTLTKHDKNKIESELNRLGSKHFLNEYDLTDLVNFLINTKHLESAAKLILFKPKCDMEKILSNLSMETISLFFEETNHSPDTNNYDFIEQLIIKLGYKNNHNILGFDFLTSFIQIKVNGFKISDYGLNIHHHIPDGSSLSMPRKSSRQVLFSITEKCYQLFYSKGTFESPISPSDSAPVSFSDEKLQKYIRKGPLSEDDLKDFILDLLTNTRVNLDEIYPEMASLKESTLLSQFRQFIDTLPFPQPNALSKALAEYDQMQANSL